MALEIIRQTCFVFFYLQSTQKLTLAKSNTVLQKMAAVF